MIRIVSLVLFCVVAALSQSSCFLRSLSDIRSEPVAPAQGYESLDKIPFKEAWHGMYFQEDKVGYSHYKIEPSGQNFTIANEAYMRLTTMKKTDEIDMKEKVVVRPDLTMVSFEHEERKNDKKMHMTGQTKGDKFVVEVTVGGEKLVREYPLDQKLYHPSSAGFIPALKGLKDAAVYKFAMFRPEELRVEDAEQLVTQVKGDPGPQGAVWKVRNNFGKTVVLSWLNKQGQTVIDKGLDGALITILEDEAAARKFAEKKTPSKDLVLDFSLIKIAKPLPNPEKLRFLKVKMRGIDPSLIVQDRRQRVSTGTGPPSDGFEVTVSIETFKLSKETTQSQGSSEDREPSDDDLADTVSIQSNHPEMTAQAKLVVSPNDTPRDKITKLVQWTANNVANKIQDSFRPLASLAVLRSKEGECESHANLYTALARSQKIPTRVVTGIVYSDKVGFLYHAWAESYDNGWLAIDPTFNQIPADATHIKLFTGESVDKTETPFKVAGKVKMEVLEYR